MTAVQAQASRWRQCLIIRRCAGLQPSDFSMANKELEAFAIFDDNLNLIFLLFIHIFNHLTLIADKITLFFLLPPLKNVIGMK